LLNIGYFLNQTLVLNSSFLASHTCTYCSLCAS